eukprot:scaffold370691_cov34-Prasinocladus_malaysianus.AAC.1
MARILIEPQGSAGSRKRVATRGEAICHERESKGTCTGSLNSLIPALKRRIILPYAPPLPWSLAVLKTDECNVTINEN